MIAMKALHPSIMVRRRSRHGIMQTRAEGLMTDTPGSRLWPLALMGWLAAYPPETQDGRPDRRPMAEERDAAVEASRPGQRTAWLRAARQRYAALTPEERQSLRQTRAVRRRAGLGPDPFRG
jgi:hypothetical protein